MSGQGMEGIGAAYGRHPVSIRPWWAALAVPLALLLIAAPCVQAAQPLSGTRLAPIDIPYQRHVLPNGLTLIVHEDRKAPIVAVSAWFRVGGRDEPPGKAGFAHLFEHINFPEGHERIMQAAGASGINASTRNDYTNYFQVVPSSALDVALWMESVRMLPASDDYLQQRLAVERGIVKGEKTYTASRAPNVDNEAAIMWKNTYPRDHPYFHSGLGSDAELDGANLDDIKQWMMRYQGAANALLVVAGDVDADVVKRKVEHYFGDIAPGPAQPRADRWIAQMRGERRMVTSAAGIDSPRMHKVWNVPPLTSEDFSHLELAARTLGDGSASRLYQRLVIADQVATEVSVQVNGRQLGSQFRIRVRLVDGAASTAVERAIDEEMARFLSEGPGREEIDRAVMASYAQVAQTVERVDANGGKAHYLALGELHAGDAGWFARALDWKRAAATAQVRDAARRWLSDGSFTLVVHPEPAFAAAATVVDRTTPPASGAAAEWSLPALEHAILSNGLKVALLQRRNAPIVRMSLRLDAGSLAEDPGKAGVAPLALRMLYEGARAGQGEPLAERAQRLGMGVRTEVALDTSSLSFTAFTGRVPESLALFAQVLSADIADRALLDRLKRQAAAAARGDRVKPPEIALRHLSQALYADSPAHAALLSRNVDEAALASLSVADLRDFVQRWIRPDNATLLVVGDTSTGELVPLLEHYLAVWKAPAAPLPSLPSTHAGASAAPRIFLVDHPGAAQSEIAVGRVTMPRAAADYGALEAVNGLLGQRLTERLREARSLTYDVSSELRPARRAGALLVRTVVSRDGTVDAVGEIASTLAAMRAGAGLEANEVERYRNGRILEFPAGNESSEQILSSLATVLDFGLPDGYWNDVVRGMRSLTPEVLRTASERSLDAQGFTWVVVGDAASIESGLRALKLGEVVVVPADAEASR